MPPTALFAVQIRAYPRRSGSLPFQETRLYRFVKTDMPC